MYLSSAAMNVIGEDVLKETSESQIDRGELQRRAIEDYNDFGKIQHARVSYDRRPSLPDDVHTAGIEVAEVTGVNLWY